MNSFVDTCVVGLIYLQCQSYEWSIKTIPGRFSSNYHVLFQMQAKFFEFRTKIMAGQIRKNGNLSFLKVFQKIDVHAVLVLTNIIIGQLNTKFYDSDNGIPKFCICENLETHFHLVLFEHCHDYSLHL